MSPSVCVYSLFRSIQGESRFAGYSCAFIRLAGCTVGCSYCDTRESWDAVGQWMKIADLVDWATAQSAHHVEVTGGEPLEQTETPALLRALCDTGATVLLETSGTEPLERVDERVHVVMDVKCPSAKANRPFVKANLQMIGRYQADVKFVVADKEDLETIAGWVAMMPVNDRLQVHLSPAGDIDLYVLANWILDGRLPIKLQPQLHKLVWPNATTEV